MNEIKIGCIGAGNMGKAILQGVSVKYKKEDLFCYDCSVEQTASLRSIVNICGSSVEVAEKSNVLLLAVKPYVVPEILKGLAGSIREDHIIVSIAAGITIASMEEVLGGNVKIVRVMPNTPALVNESISVLSANQALTDEDVSEVKEIFSLVGKAILLPEKNLDAVTGLSGCGPAYGFTIIQALADAGVENGIPRKEAVLLAAQTLKGAAEMVMRTGEEPIGLRNKVTTPGGSTIAAIHVLEKCGFSGILMDAVKRATEVSSEQGKKK